jgi:hypothetical protein
MMAYQRKVAYIDLYRGTTKIKNAGFAKIEQRDRQVRIYLHIKTPTDYESELADIYVLRSTKAGVERKKAGEMSFCSRLGEVNLEWEEDKLPFTELCGVYVAGPKEEQYHFKSQWSGAASSSTQTIQVAEVGKTSEGNGTEGEKQSENKVVEAENQQVEAPQMKEQQMEAQQTEAQQTEENRGLWEQIGSRYTKIPGRLLGYDCECMKMTPADLRCLPRCYWQLAGNSFLLHGYYQYRYVVLLRFLERENYRYYAGVPGVKNPQQEKMAELFGFTDFFEIAQKQRAPATGIAFNGYWCTELPRLMNLH